MKIEAQKKNKWEQYILPIILVVLCFLDFNRAIKKEITGFQHLPLHHIRTAPQNGFQRFGRADLTALHPPPLPAAVRHPPRLPQKCNTFRRLPDFPRDRQR